MRNYQKSKQLTSCQVMVDFWAKTGSVLRRGPSCSQGSKAFKVPTSLVSSCSKFAWLRHGCLGHPSFRAPKLLQRGVPHGCMGLRAAKLFQQCSRHPKRISLDDMLAHSWMCRLQRLVKKWEKVPGCPVPGMGFLQVRGLLLASDFRRFWGRS